MKKPIALHKVDPLKAGAEVYVLNGTKVLMFERSPDSPMFPNYWVGPGGHVDSNEDFLTAAIREVYEETGVTVKPTEVKLKALTIHRRPDRDVTWILPIFYTNISAHQELKDSTEGNARWIEIEELTNMDLIFPASEYYFDHVLNDKPGILYTNIVWSDKGLEEESSVVMDIDG